jgi:hypothetical protein
MPSSPEDEDSTTKMPIADLEKEERRWFSWLSVLHERISKADSPNGAIILDIAKKRWLQAREALRRQNTDEQGTDN